MQRNSESTKFERDIQKEESGQRQAVKAKKVPFWVMIMNPGRALGGYWLFIAGTAYNGIITRDTGNIIFFAPLAGIFLWMYLASKAKKSQYYDNIVDFTAEQKKAKYRNWIVISGISLLLSLVLS